MLEDDAFFTSCIAIHFIAIHFKHCAQQILNKTRVFFLDHGK